MTNNKIIKWLFASSKLPPAPPIWIVVLIFGVIYNAIEKHWWVVLFSLIWILIIKLFNITPEKYNAFHESIILIKRKNK